MKQPTHPILLIEDSPEDTEAMRRAFKRAGLANPIQHCMDGDDALDFLLQRNQYAEAGKATRPGIILLDLNLPGTDGREVLAQIKQNESLMQIPVVVLTTSSDERDIDKCYKLGANSYIMKPVDFNGFLQAIQRLSDYWFEVVILPKRA
ncbi:MAG: response regulator [Methylocystis sp.]